MKTRLAHIRWFLGVVALLAGSLVGLVLSYVIPDETFTAEAQWSFFGLSIAFGGMLILWSTEERTGLSPQLSPNHRRHQAHAYPFLIARFCVMGSLCIGLAMGLLHFSRNPSLNGALSTSVITYLLLTPPTFGVYLGLRWLLRSTAEGVPGADPIGGARQSIRMRVLFAVQVPAVMCGIGITLLTNSADQHYTANVADQNNELRVHIQEQSQQILGPEHFVASKESSDAITHDSDQDPDWHALVLLIAVMSLSYYFCGSFAEDVCRDLEDLSSGLANIENLRARPVGPWVGLRETEEILIAFRDVVQTYREQRRLIEEAAKQRREAEGQKSTFLAHVSHELKSPLNSILGFSELLLAELDGPLTQEQKHAAGEVWLLGDRLLRFILALLDLARLDSTTGRDTQPDTPDGLKVKACCAADLAQAIHDQCRHDPLERHTLDIQLVESENACTTTALDPGQTARALLLVAGTLTDALNHGHMGLKILDEDDSIRVQLMVIDGEARPSANQSISRAWAAIEDTADYEPTLETTALPIQLLCALVDLQGGHIQVRQQGAWPRLTLTCPPSTT